MKHSGSHLLTLSEHLSRLARFELFNLVRKMTEEELKKNRRSRGRLPVLKVVADELGVSVATVKAWGKGSWQASNVNTSRLLAKAFEMDSEKALEILREDLTDYSLAINRSEVLEKNE